MDAAGIEKEERSLPRFGASPTPDVTKSTIENENNPTNPSQDTLAFKVRRLIDHVIHILNEHI